MEGKPVKTLNRCFVALLACACWFSAGTARAALTDPAQIQTEAYVNLVQADQSLDAGRLDEALAQYKVARDYYLQLAKDFPGWEPRVIQYRKTYCDNQIADVEHRQSGGQPAELPELAPEPTPAPAVAASKPVVVAAPEPKPTSASDRSVEIDYLKSRIASLEAELAEFDNLQDEAEVITAQNEQLKKDLEAANQQLAEKRSGEQAALDGLRAELAAKDDTVKALEKDLESKKQLDQALNDMEGKANDLRAENERLKKEIKTLDEELDSAEVRADQAELQAKQAEAGQKDVERDLKNIREDLADAEKELAALQRKPIFEKPAREKNEPKANAKVESKPEPKPEPKAIEKAPETAKVVPVEEPKAEPAPDSPVLATVPPKTVPKGMAAADYVRQLLQDGDNDGALATVQEARKAAPADMNLLLIEGITLIRLQRYPEAATLLIDLAKNNPRNAEAHATLGAAMMGAGFYEEARETLLMAVKLDKNLPECHYNLAQLYAFVDPVDLRLARKYYKQARDLGLAPDKQIEKALK
jgi:hypothetical protein